MLFLDAVQLKPTLRPPVWLMRQAGRYLPEYRALRTRYTLEEMFRNPELACEITMLPIDLLGVDAAIVFSDILLIVEALGLQVRYPEKGGPQVEPKLQKEDDIYALSMRPLEDTLAYTYTAVEMLCRQLKIPLIGFCGGPFTIASYMFPQGEILSWIDKSPQAVHHLLSLLQKACERHLLLQIKAGAQVVQIFDSWANLLPESLIHEFAFAYLEKIIQALPVPVILFCRDSGLYAQRLAALGCQVISLDENANLEELVKTLPHNVALQGNLSPQLLTTGPSSLIVQKTKELVRIMHPRPGFIANLGHGVLPTTPVDHVRCFIDTIHQEASGGIEHKIASGLPPDKKPNFVPRS